MELIYFIIKSVVATYVLNQVWFYIKSDKIRLWDRFTPQQKEKKQVNPAPLPASLEQEISVVGKSHTVYISPQEPGNMDETELPQDTEPDDIVVDDRLPDDMELKTYQESIEDILKEEDLFSDEGDYADNEFSSGMTYETISNAIDVVMGRKKGEQEQLEAARTLYEVRQCDMMDFFSSQAGNFEVIEQLLQENLDENGFPLPEKRKKTKNIEDFDIDNFV